MFPCRYVSEATNLQPDIADRDAANPWFRSKAMTTVVLSGSRIRPLDGEVDLGVGHVLLRRRFPGQSRTATPRCPERVGDELIPAFGGS